MLIECKECKSEVSDKAASCPKCGFPIKPPINYRKSSEGLFLKSMNFGCLLFIIFIVFGFIIVFKSIYKPLN